MSDGSPARTLEGRFGTVCSLGFSPDGAMLAINSGASSTRDERFKEYSDRLLII